MLAALAAVLVVASVHGARAQEPTAPKHSDDPAAAEARRHYEEGTKAFNLGEFPRAIAEFKAAYNAKDDPSLLYNIAQSFRLENDATQAIFFYRSFLRNMPTAPNRREVEGRIRTLEKQLEEKKEDQKKEAAAPVVAPPAAVTAPPAVAPAPVAEPPPATATVPAAPAGAEVAPVEEPLPAAPPPVEAAPVTAPAVDLTRAPAAQSASSSPSTPFYKKWWFWTAVGVVAVVGAGAGIAAARDKPPSTSLGLYDPIFMKP